MAPAPAEIRHRRHAGSQARRTADRRRADRGWTYRCDRAATLGDGAETVDCIAISCLPDDQCPHAHWQTALRSVAPLDPAGVFSPRPWRPRHRVRAEDIISPLWPERSTTRPWCHDPGRLVHNNPNTGAYRRRDRGAEGKRHPRCLLPVAQAPTPSQVSRNFSEVPHPRKEIERL